MDVWGELAGQEEAVAALRGAASGGPLTHAWLITGPPGSGRSNLAYAFATELLARGANPADREQIAAQVAAHTHPDLSALVTDRVIITIDEVRHLVSNSQLSPALSPYRVMVLEDADRMTERTSNLLLKALEEPPATSIWVLCAPSEADLLPTIRSRVRTVRLRMPTVAEVAALLVERDGVDAETAKAAARQAQSHIGMARRLANSPGARARRAETLRLVFETRTVPRAVFAAAQLLEIADADAEAVTEETDAQEKAAFLRSLGVVDAASLPAALRSQLKRLEEDQKRRATRSLRDGLDRIFVDLLSIFRDLLMLQLGSPSGLVNLEFRAELVELAARSSAKQTLTVMDAVTDARTRLAGNVSPLVALEALMVVISRLSGSKPALPHPDASNSVGATPPRRG